MDFAVADTRRADADALAGTLDQRMNRLQVQIPAAVADIVGVTDAVSELGPTAADFTNFCHKYTLPAKHG